MDLDAVWRAVDAERSGLADLFDDLTAAEWETPSLCDGWRVRDVAAHLTLAHMGAGVAAVELVRARGSLDRMIHETAVRRADRGIADLAPALRAMVGSRRTIAGLTPMEPLLDTLVHGQDVAVPLGRARAVPVAPAAAAATRVWSIGRPFRARRRLAGLRLTATDVSWAVGEGAEVRGPVAALLLLLTGRDAVALPALDGDGVADLTARLAGAAHGTGAPGTARTTRRDLR